MKKLSIGQLKAVSEISGNIAVAWFTAGVISPMFVRPKNPVDFLSNLMLGLTMTVLFTLLSLDLVRGVKS